MRSIVDSDLLKFDNDVVVGDELPFVGDRRKHPDSYKTLVLNADYTPIRYYPLSTWSWQQTMKMTYGEDVVDIVALHDYFVRTQHREYQLPSVVALRTFVPPPQRVPFTRYNVYLRDLFTCQYCGERFDAAGLTFDHVIPKSRGGRGDWENISAACHHCNLTKANRTPAEAKMHPRVWPYQPSVYEIREKGRQFPPRHLHETWNDFLYWSVELEPT